MKPAFIQYHLGFPAPTQEAAIQGSGTLRKDKKPGSVTQRPSGCWKE